MSIYVILDLGMIIILFLDAHRCTLHEDTTNEPLVQVLP